MIEFIFGFMLSWVICCFYKSISRDRQINKLEEIYHIEIDEHTRDYIRRVN